MTSFECVLENASKLFERKKFLKKENVAFFINKKHCTVGIVTPIYLDCTSGKRKKRLSSVEMKIEKKKQKKED